MLRVTPLVFFFSLLFLLLLSDIKKEMVCTITITHELQSCWQFYGGDKKSEDVRGMLRGCFSLCCFRLHIYIKYWQRQPVTSVSCNWWDYVRTFKVCKLLQSDSHRKMSESLRLSFHPARLSWRALCCLFMLAVCQLFTGQDPDL